MPRGGWKQISEGLGSKFGVIKTRKAVMERYYAAMQPVKKRRLLVDDVSASVSEDETDNSSAAEQAATVQVSLHH